MNIIDAIAFNIFVVCVCCTGSGSAKQREEWVGRGRRGGERHTFCSLLYARFLLTQALYKLPVLILEHNLLIINSTICMLGTQNVMNQHGICQVPLGLI